MKLIFDTHDNEKQKDAVRAWINPDITEVDYGGGKGGGKTYLGCKLIFGDALMYPKTRYFIARKELNDLRKYTLSSVQECFETWGLDPKKYYTFNGQDNYFTLHNGSQVYFLQAKYIPSDPEYYRFGSMQFTRGWIEEAGELESAAKNNLQAAVGRWMNKEYNLAPKLLQTFNPSKNYLYKRYKESKAGLLPSHVVYIQALLDDNKMLSPEYKKNLLRSLTKAQIERLVYGNMEYDDDPTAMMDYDAICDLFTNEIEKSGNKCISADLAMKGRDKFIAGAAEGYVMTIEIDKVFSPARMIEEDLRGLMKKTSTGRSQLIADSDGLGQFIGSYLEGINEFHGGARAYASDKYFNLRSECYYKLAELVNARKIRVVCTEEQQERIKDELGVIKASNIEDPEKKLRVISKEDMSELLGHSPDYADMLMMWMVRFVSDTELIYGDAKYANELSEGRKVYGLKIGEGSIPYSLCVASINNGLSFDSLIYSTFNSLNDFANAVNDLGFSSPVMIMCYPSKVQYINDLNRMCINNTSFLLCKESKEHDSWSIDLIKRNNPKFVDNRDIRNEIDNFYYDTKDGKMTSEPCNIKAFPFMASIGASIQYETSLR